MYQSNNLKTSNLTDEKEIMNAAYSYDYVTIETNEKFAIEFVDCYEALGWQLVKRESAITLKTLLTFKRDRKIKNKTLLQSIQVKLDEALSAINKFEKQKTKKAFITSLTVGIIGALTFGGGLGICLLNPTLLPIIGGIALGLAGLGISWIAYLAYIKIYSKVSKEMNIVIDEQREKIAFLCEEANKTTV